jgi:hypothetical protein
MERKKHRILSLLLSLEFNSNCFTVNKRFRQEIKIRPGYTPQEDVSLYRNSKQLEMDRHRAIKGSIPGLKPNSNNPLLQDALKGVQGGSKSAKKNAKRKEKKIKEEDEVKDSWDDDDNEEGAENTNSSTKESTPKIETENLNGPTTPTSPPTASSSTPTVTTENSAMTTTTEDPVKRLRNLRKKLKQTQQLKEKLDGGASLGPAEKDKVDGMKSLEEEIAKLELS